MSAEEAAKHYKSQVPGLRSKFRRRLASLRDEYSRKDLVFTGAYVDAIMDAAEDALRERMTGAADSLRRAMNSGWRPHDNEIQGAFTQCFNNLNDNENSFSDIENCITNATESLGRPDADLESRFRRKIGELQLATSIEVVADLTMHLREVSANERLSQAAVAYGAVEEKSMRVGANRPTVFITHGRDNAARDGVRSFIYSLDLEPIVLEDEANAGLTVIEKYEKHAKTSFGIAILTPDDLGCLAAEQSIRLNPRARQNVIFELGYMFARIGRNRVSVLLTVKDLEIPTNVDGIAWLFLDQYGGWKDRLRKELIAAGLISAS